MAFAIQKPLLAFVTLALLTVFGCQSGTNNSTTPTNTNNSSNSPSVNAVNPATIATEPRGTNPKTLKIALLSNQDSLTINKAYEGLKTSLATQLGKEVELVAMSSEADMVNIAKKEGLDVALFGPLSYFLNDKNHSNLEPFVVATNKEGPSYEAVLIGNIQSGVNSIKDVTGKTIAFTEPRSTHGHLIPKMILAEQGLQPEKSYKQIFLGSHDAVALAVQNNQAQVGGLSRHALKSLVDRKAIDRTKIKILAESPEFPPYYWTMRSDLNPELKGKIRAAFVQVKDKTALTPLNADSFIAIDDKNYGAVKGLFQ